MEFQLGMKRLERILNTWDMNGATHQKSDSGEYEVNECRICGHIWRTRSDSVPKTCPACRTSLWNREGVKEKRCYRCGHIWHSSLENPARCPSCKSKVWNRENLRVTCRRCGSKWESPLKNGCDVVCPTCGRLDPDDYSISARIFKRRVEIPKEMNEGLTPDVITEMHSIEGDLFRSMFLRDRGLTPLQADVIVLYDKGIPVSKISSEMGVAVSDIIMMIVQYRHLMESMGVTL